MAQWRPGLRVVSDDERGAIRSYGAAVAQVGEQGRELEVRAWIRTRRDLQRQCLVGWVEALGDDTADVGDILVAIFDRAAG